jgi:hypothetical protein
LEDRLRLYSQREVQELHRCGKRSFGSPMPLPHPKGKIKPPEDSFRGLIGEHAVMGLLNLICCSKEESRVFHSVGVSDEMDGETDHILLYKNQLFIIETKNYSNYSSIYIDRTGVTYGRKHGKIIQLNDNGILKKIKMYQDKFPQLNVEGVMVVTQNDSRLGSEYSKYSMISINHFMDFFDKKLAKSSDYTNDSWLVIKYFANLCIRNETYY